MAQSKTSKIEQGLRALGWTEDNSWPGSKGKCWKGGTLPNVTRITKDTRVYTGKSAGIRLSLKGPKCDSWSISPADSVFSKVYSKVYYSIIEAAGESK